MDVVLLFPGQGSQKPGMGKDLVAAFPAAADVFRQADEALGEPLSTLCFEGPADTLTLTHNAQPALLAHGAAVWAVTRDALGDAVRAAAGHSLGEFTAYCATGALAVPDAIRLVRQRGTLMYESGLARPGAMAAILGDTTRTIDEICVEASASPEGGLVVPANYNSPGQVVVSGEVASVERAMELSKQAGAKRAIRLPVSGAFHSPLMQSAWQAFAQTLSHAPIMDPSVPVYANVNAEPVTRATDARRLLLEQLTAPVRWIQVVENLVRDFPGALFVEMGPGSVLTGLVKKIAPGAECVACGTPAEVETLLSRTSRATS
ncbi:MAG TPA: ACP S-malonyltransferase [Gemmatimonadaceae bacterium]